MPINKNYRFLRFVRQAFIIFAFLFPLIFSGLVYADDPCKNINDLDDKAKCYEDQKKKKENKYQSVSSKLSDVRTQKDSVAKKISELSSKLSITQEEIDELASEINKMEEELNIISKNLNDRKTSLSGKINLRNRVLRNYYQTGKLNDLETFLTLNSSSGLTGFQLNTMAYIFEKSLTSETLRIIGALNSEISSYEKDKKEAEELKKDLETQQAGIIALKNQLANQKNTAQDEFADLKNKEDKYSSELVSLQAEIDKLSAKQKEILNAKYGTESGTVGDYESPAATVPDPPFKPAFGMFSYGAYTHYNGMSQYGVKGRADDGKDYKEVLKFYYKVDVKKQDDFPDRINVSGYGEMDYQDYLYGIAEMPSDWPEDALKAQAIAARTYAYRSKKPICTTESCQVFLKSKADNPPKRWKEAVDDTKDVILDNPSTSQYSSTTGGYINNVGWDTKGSWPNDAYEKKAKSPWFYWAWYSKNYRFDSDKCGRSHPWLNEKELADILNAWVVWRGGSGSDKSRISPVTTKCWGGDPYSIDDMADRADDLGKKYTKVTKASADIGNNGITSKVSFETNNGSVSIDGQEFKTVFNLRAPGYVSIRSRLFDMKTEN